MSCLRPATPGFVVTLAAAILLAIVSFCVPYFKSVFFLRASLTEGGVDGSITFGTLGYCLELSNDTICSKPSVGYELDINGLVGNDLPIQIPQVVVKWLTTALVLHIAALIAASVSALFGLLAHVREMSMTSFSTIISGIAAVIALFAFIFDLILFFVAKARISSVGSAQMGSAVWLTFAAWILLFFSGCLYSCGRRCISDRKKPYKGRDEGVGNNSRNNNSRLDRKLSEHPSEVGLPEFPEFEPPRETEPLTAIIDGDAVHIDPRGHPRGGYVPAASGTSAVDYYNENIYPPQRQPSIPSSHASTAYQNNVPQVPTHPLPSYGSYRYATPSPHIPMPDPNTGPSYFSATGPEQRSSYSQYPITSSPSPLQDSSYNSLLDPPPMPSASNPPDQYFQNQPPPNQPAANPYIRPSQPSYSGYIPGGDDYAAQRIQSPPNPYVVAPQQNHHSGYTPGGADYAQRLQSPPNPYVIPPQQNRQPVHSSYTGGAPLPQKVGKFSDDTPPGYTS